MNENISIDVKICKSDFNEEWNKNFIKSYRNVEVKENKKVSEWITNWPVVYIIHTKKLKEAYIGETTNVLKRMNDHLKNPNKNYLECLKIILSNYFNKSVILDLESHLIQLMLADGFNLKNRNNGQYAHDYYNREEYYYQFKKVWEKLKEEKLVKGNYDKLLNSDMYKLSPYKNLDNYQMQVEVSVLKRIFEDLLNNKQTSIVIEGGPGTGKSVLAIHMLKRIKDLYNEKDNNEYEDDENDEDFISREVDEYLRGLIKRYKIKNKNLKIGVVVPMFRFRETFKKVVKKVEGLGEIDILSPYSFVNTDKDIKENNLKLYRCKENEYDILIVDESHRLSKENRRVRLKYEKAFENGTTQYDWIKRCSKNQILFYDRYQIIGPIDDEKLEIELLQNKNESYYYQLKSQFRCKGGNDYLQFIKDLLEEKNPQFESNYELLLFDDADEMINKIKEKDNSVNNIVARNVAGISWQNRKDKKEVLGKYKWNDMKAKDWVHSKNALNEIGCIHTVQGYDINYTGVIIGNELKYSEEKGIYVDFNEYKDQKGKSGLENNEEDLRRLKQYILNIYYVLLTRGIEGTYVYVCDEGLREYLSKYIKKYTQNSNVYKTNYKNEECLIVAEDSEEYK